MTKNEVKKFLKNAEELAIMNLRKEENALRDDAKAEIAELLLEGVDVAKIEKLVSELTMELQKVSDAFEEQFTSKCYDNGKLKNILTQLQYTDNSGLRKRLAEGVNFRNYDMPGFPKRREKIIEEFAKINGNVEGMNGKEATAYLENLGFDIPNRKKAVNAVLAPIDMNVLCGVVVCK